jgi:hypothetical protein
MGTLFNFLEYFRDVLAQNSQGEKINGTKEKDGEEDSGSSFGRYIGYQ